MTDHLYEADEPDAEAVAKLRAWRHETARATMLPTYVIMPNAVLYEVARVHPQAMEDLESIRGLGPARMERYGEEILAALASEPPKAEKAPPETSQRKRRVAPGEPLADTTAPFHVCIEYSLTDTVRRRLATELRDCAGPLSRSLMSAIESGPARVTLRVERGTTR
ncbi:MAG: hypothetical protein FJX76_07975 [Armatimonadetes bacterium]|nr:hypothetical protein [Armatimonadota bacterium]